LALRQQIDQEMVLVIWEGFEALEAPRKSSQNELIFRLTRKTDKPIVVWMSENHLKPLLHMRHHFLIYLPSSTIAKLQEGYDDYYSITSNEGALNSASAVLEDRLRQRGYKNKTWMVCGLKSFSIPRGGHRSCRRSFSRWPKLDVI
jgi:hypothetical protein